MDYGSLFAQVKEECQTYLPYVKVKSSILGADDQITSPGESLLQSSVSSLGLYPEILVERKQTEPVSKRVQEAQKRGTTSKRSDLDQLSAAAVIPQLSLMPVADPLTCFLDIPLLLQVCLATVSSASSL